MAYPVGFNYVSGPFTLRMFPVSSTLTFAKRNPVSIGGDGTISQFSAVATSIVGIAMSDSSQSESINGKNCVLVGIPEESTVFAVKVQAGVASSALTAFQRFNIEIATDHYRVDTDSTVTTLVQLVPRGDGSSDALSTDSTVNVQLLLGKIKPFGSFTTVLTT